MRIVLLLLFIAALAGCAGSDMYLGEWKATDAQENQLHVIFEPHVFMVVNAVGDTTHFEYSQNTMKFENDVYQYGITLNDGRKYTVHFPFAGDQTKGIISLPNRDVLYVISRSEYLTYSDLYNLTGE